MENPNIQIFVVYHKDSFLFDKPPFVPIQVGSGSPISGITIRDNVGDNIADKNSNFCELTAQYWIWKNVTADYVGLVHYRRIPSFSGVHAGSFCDFSEATCVRFGWNTETISSLLENHDILMPPNWAVFPPGEPGNIMTPYEFHCVEHRASDIEEIMRVIRDVSPDMYDYAVKALCETKKECFGNVCVMRKDLFDNYCEWLFRVLFELEKRIELPDDKEQARLFGFLSERLVMVWLLFAKSQFGARIWYSNALPLGDFGEELHPETITAKVRQPIENPVLSVIVPIYNTAPYLYKCLNSICNQAFEQIEIICVDDGSTDDSFDILSRFADVDKRIRIVRCANGGPGLARNKGLDIACGKYITFVDSDDWVDRYIWWRSIRKMEAHDLEMLFFELVEVDDSTGKKRFDNWGRLRFGHKCYRDSFTWRDIGRNPFLTCCYAYNRVIRRDFWGNRRFPTTYCVGEDAPVHYSLLFSAKRIGAYECPFYFYRQRPNSLMSDHKNMVRILDGHINVIRDTYRDLQEYPFRDELMPYYGDYVCRMLCNTYLRWRTNECLMKIRNFLRAPEQSWMLKIGNRRSRHMIMMAKSVLKWNLANFFERREAYNTNDIHTHGIIKMLRNYVKRLLPHYFLKSWLYKKYGIVAPSLSGGCFERFIKGCLPYVVVENFLPEQEKLKI